MALCGSLHLLLAPAATVALLLAVLFLVLRPRPVRIPIKGRHVFITGGSSGIGLALAKRVAAEGARVSILARSLPKLEVAREEIRRATGTEVTIYSADVRDEQAVKEAVEAAGEVDVLVCNQGVFLPRELATQDLEEVKYTMDINVMGTFNLIRYALPGMKRGGEAAGPRSIAIVSSQAGQVRDQCQKLKRKPEITAILAASSTMMELEDLITKTLDGIKSGTFLVTCNLEGIILSLSTAGGAPTRSPTAALLEVAFAGFMRFIGLWVLSGWYVAIRKCHAKQKSKELMKVPMHEGKTQESTYRSSDDLLVPGLLLSFDNNIWIWEC
ncbi:hypothetical protein Taro_053210 [Colocasia esculenta]|uniref:Ketoreductase domain-containing protein n=1 Tax=Colocasia esculenta TaxID=4460 RepID=A0A843XKK0_COLES|nr:hypothetical protein [Colocasia esculenta]